MNTRRCLRIADRIRLPFLEATGIAIDPQRMVDDPEYALDVLTVCDARPGSLVHELAGHYRLAQAESIPAVDTGPADTTGWGSDTTGFGASRPAANSVFEQERQAVRAARRSPDWMAPGRWRGHDT